MFIFSFILKYLYYRQKIYPTWEESMSSIHSSKLQPLSKELVSGLIRKITTQSGLLRMEEELSPFIWLHISQAIKSHFSISNLLNKWIEITKSQQRHSDYIHSCQTDHGHQSWFSLELIFLSWQISDSSELWWFKQALLRVNL